MNYHNITKVDMLNGDGLRVVLWLAGCNHKCKDCQNPETWDCNGGIPFDNDAKDEIFAELEKDYVSGITFSGGDPLFPGNRDEVFALMQETHKKFPCKTIWCYTGYTFEQVKDWEGLKYVDVLVDGPFIPSMKELGLKWKGSSNQRLVLAKKSIKDGKLYVIDNDTGGETLVNNWTGCSCGY